MIQTSALPSSKFLFLVLFILYAGGASSNKFEIKSDSELSSIRPIDGGVRSLDGVNSTWQDVGRESERQGRFFQRDSRLFGARRRIQFALLPIMFKLGVISTMLVGLTVMMLKGLTIGVILLFFALGNSFLKYKYHQPHQPVHFHLHPSDFHPSAPVYHHGYGHSEPWDKVSEQFDSAPAYENYDPGSHHKIIPFRYPYRYPHHDPYAYHGK